MNKIFIGAVIVAGVTGLIWLGSPKGSETKSPVAESSGSGLLILEESIFDFGEISMAAGDVSHVFKIKNTGTGPVVIRKMYTSCMCTTAQLIYGDKKFGPYGMAGHGFIPSINETINPGEEASVEVVFDPKAHGPAGVGKIQRVVTIDNNAGSPMELSFSALVTP